MVHSLYANPELGGSTGHCQPITYQNKEEHIYYNQSLTYNKNTTTLHTHEKVNIWQTFTTVGLMHLTYLGISWQQPLNKLNLLHFQYPWHATFSYFTIITFNSLEQGPSWKAIYTKSGRRSSCSYCQIMINQDTKAQVQEVTSWKHTVWV
jgi:hypothetical protein